MINLSQPPRPADGADVADEGCAYPKQDASGTPTIHTEKDGYTVPYDEPFDYADPNPYHEADVVAVLSQDGTQAHFRVLHLQRLANPLLPFDADDEPLSHG